MPQSVCGGCKYFAAQGIDMEVKEILKQGFEVQSAKDFCNEGNIFQKLEKVTVERTTSGSPKGNRQPIYVSPCTQDTLRLICRWETTPSSF